MSASNSVSEQKTTQTAYNQQVGADNGSLALGAGASGNTINVTTDSLDALHESLGAAMGITHDALGSAENIAGASIAGNVDATKTALASNVAIGGAAIASNTNIAGASLALANNSLLSGNATAEKSLAGLTQISGASLALANNVAAGAIQNNRDAFDLSRDTTGLSIAGNLEALHASLDASGGATSHALDVVESASGKAIDLARNVTGSALNFGNTALAANDSLSTKAFNFGGAAIAANLDALHSSLDTVSISQANSDNLVQSVVGQFTNVLGITANNALQVAANAAPQTDQALLERLATGQVITDQGAAVSAANASKGIQINWGLVLTAGAVIAVAYYYIKTAGK